MRLSDQLACLAVAASVAAIVVAYVASGIVGMPAAFALFGALAALAFFVLLPRTWRWMWMRAYRRLGRELECEDLEAAARLIDALALDATGPTGRATLAVTRADLPLFAERWQEAIAALRAIDRSALPLENQLVVDNNLAWALAHDGAADEALALARATVDRASAAPGVDAASRGAYLGTLGVALLHAGMAEQGLALLRQALTHGGSPRMQCTRYLYIGDAERALGRPAEAHAAYAESARLAPHSRPGRRAAERLNSASAMPYR